MVPAPEMVELSVFRTRRSVKPVDMDTSHVVSRAVLREIFEDAHRAPTHGLTQPWRFQVFDNVSARARLGDALQALYDGATPEAARNVDKRAKLAAAPRLAPVVIAIAARVEIGGRIPEIEEIAATSCAVENLLLSAHARGLGAYWSTPPVAMSPELGAWLGFDATHRMLGLVYLGYPIAGATVLPLSPRNPLAAHVMFHDA